MHTTHDIKNLLDIQDPNITFSDACVEIKQDRGKVCKFISATLTYIPTHCAVCGMKNEHFSVIKNGTQTSRITLPLTGVHRTFLLLKKQRFFCKSCSCTFVARSSIVDRHCFISNQTKARVTMKATEAQSITLIAQDAMISVSSVQRFIQAYAN
ncbi:transposase, partial [Listeria monocytogenes]|nr:transposase [Listeria monocytogenes]